MGAYDIVIDYIQLINLVSCHPQPPNYAVMAFPPRLIPYYAHDDVVNSISCFFFSIFFCSQLPLPPPPSHTLFHLFLINWQNADHCDDIDNTGCFFFFWSDIQNCSMWRYNTIRRLTRNIMVWPTPPHTHTHPLPRHHWRLDRQLFGNAFVSLSEFSKVTISYSTAFCALNKRPRSVRTGCCTSLGMLSIQHVGMFFPLPSRKSRTPANNCVVQIAHGKTVSNTSERADTAKWNVLNYSRLAVGLAMRHCDLHWPLNQSMTFDSIYFNFIWHYKLIVALSYYRTVVCIIKTQALKENLGLKSAE